MNIQYEKKILRTQIKERKNAISIIEKQQRSENILHQLETLKVFEEAKTILLYWSMDDEVATHSFIEKHWKTKTLLLPSVKENDLELKIYQGKKTMIAGSQFGILEPSGEVYTHFSNIDLMIVPGVAFDADGNRMGRGRGFYDRLLANLQTPKVGICFDFQIITQVPHEPFDIQMDMVISETMIYIPR